MPEKTSIHCCPECKGSQVFVTDSRPLSPDQPMPVIRRTRRCKTCTHRWSTYEMPAELFEQLRDAVERFSFMRPNAQRNAAERPT